MSDTPSNHTFAKTHFDDLANGLGGATAIQAIIAGFQSHLPPANSGDEA